MTRQQWEQIFTLQAEANNKLVGSTDWLYDPIKYDFIQCCLAEANEATDSWGWAPWWKPAPALDMSNVKLELIDLLHFHTSAVMQHASIMGTSVENAIETGVAGIMNYVKPAVAPKQLENGTKAMQRYQQALLTNGPVVALHFLLDLFGMAGMSMEEASARYLAKNALNVFRANIGYKKNKDVKYWRNPVSINLKGSVDSMDAAVALLTEHGDHAVHSGERGEGFINWHGEILLTSKGQREDNDYVMDMVTKLIADGATGLTRDEMLFAIGEEYTRITGKECYV